MAAAVVLGVTFALARRGDAMMQSPRPATPCDSTVGRALPPPSFAPAALAGNYALTLVARSDIAQEIEPREAFDYWCWLAHRRTPGPDWAS